MSPFITDYYHDNNQSNANYWVLTNEIQKNIANGKMLSPEEYDYSQFSSSSVSENSLKELMKIIQLKFVDINSEFLQLINVTDLQSRGNIISDVIKFASNFLNSINNMSKFIKQFDNKFISTIKPEIEIDNDGELIFEWYGRKGVRANLTFGRNGELFFVSLFHGESMKSKLFINKSSIEKIKTELVKIANDNIL
jgi:hypothetical protein